MPAPYFEPSLNPNMLEAIINVLGKPQRIAGKWFFDQPAHLDDPRYTHDINGKKRRFEDHYKTMLLTFKKAALQVIPSIIDFHAFLDPF